MQFAGIEIHWRLQEGPLAVRWREDALRNYPLIRSSIVEVLELAFFAGHHEQVEVVVDFLLRLLPVLVMEVVVDPHEALVEYLRHDVLAELQLLGLGQLNLKARAHPAHVQRLVKFLFLSTPFVSLPVRFGSSLFDQIFESEV